MGRGISYYDYIQRVATEKLAQEDAARAKRGGKRPRVDAGEWLDVGFNVTSEMSDRIVEHSFTGKDNFYDYRRELPWKWEAERDEYWKRQSENNRKASVARARKKKGPGELH